MNEIKFSKKNGYYSKFGKQLMTTVRRWTPEKEKYYREQIGTIFKIVNTDYDFKGIPETDLLMLLFELRTDFTLLLLQVIKCHYNDLSPEFIEYDTDTEKESP